MRNLVLPLIIVCLSVAVVGCGPSKEERQADQQKADVAREIKAANDAPAAPASTNK